MLVRLNFSYFLTVEGAFADQHCVDKDEKKDSGGSWWKPAVF